MKAIRTMGALFVLLLGVLLLFVPSTWAADRTQDQERGGSFQFERPMNLDTSPASSSGGLGKEEAGMKASEIPMRAPQGGEGAHLLAPKTEHFLSMGAPSLNAGLEEQLRVQDEISGYSF